MCVSPSAETCRCIRKLGNKCLAGCPTSNLPRIQMTTIPTIAKLPQRGPTHRIDTKALRQIIAQLNEDWIIRNLEERDYGIDMQLELFDRDSPTGYMTLIQVKGTEKSLSAENAKLGVKTLHYAELFNMPFFLFRTSLADNETQFIWLQKYIATDLEVLNPRWRTKKEKVVIHVPSENILSKNQQKFKDIVTAQALNAKALAFVGRADALRRFLNDALTGKSGKSNAIYCLEEVRGLHTLMDFIVSKNDKGESIRPYWQKTLAKVEAILNALITKPTSFTYSGTQKKIIKDFLHALDSTTHSYFVSDDTYRSLVYAHKQTKGKFPLPKPPF